jgi:cell division protein FtsL
LCPDKNFYFFKKKSMQIDLKERTPQLIAIIGVLSLILIIAVVYIVSKNRQITVMEQQFAVDKQELEDEYEAISMQYEGFKFSVQNDSLLYKLENEQAKVQRLQEQLRMTDAANKAEIKRLKDELATLRKVLKSYVQQIDSLHRLNTELQAKNEQITRQYQQTSRTLSQVAQEKEQLSEKVTLASRLDATGITVKAVNDRGREQKRLSRSSQFVVSFLLAKNITAEPGERTIYVRIMTPDGGVLTKNPGSTFPYENGNLQYSMKRIVEYGGEETPVTMYWDIEEFLMPGTYKADIFADGSLIGSRSFSMEE